MVLALQTPIIAQIIIHHCTKVFTTDQARGNPEHFVNICIAAVNKYSITYIAFDSFLHNRTPCVP